jgi:hypothetical protein
MKENKITKRCVIIKKLQPTVRIYAGLGLEILSAELLPNL